MKADNFFFSQGNSSNFSFNQLKERRFLKVLLTALNLTWITHCLTNKEKSPTCNVM